MNFPILWQKSATFGQQQTVLFSVMIEFNNLVYLNLRWGRLKGTFIMIQLSQWANVAVLLGYLIIWSEKKSNDEGN